MFSDCPVNSSAPVVPTVSGYLMVTQCILLARQRPTVSTPLTWDEVAAVTESRDPDDLVFTAPEVVERVAEHGDLFGPVASLEQALPKLG